MPWGGFAITSCAVLAGFLRFPPHEMIDELGGQRGEEPGIERQMGHRLVDRLEQRHALARIFRPLEGERLARVDIHSFCSANQRGSGATTRFDGAQDGRAQIRSCSARCSSARRRASRPDRSGLGQSVDARIAAPPRSSWRYAIRVPRLLFPGDK